VASCPNVASPVGNGDALGGVGWLGRSLQGGVELGGQQDGVHRLGVGGGSGGRSRRGRGRGSGRVASGFPSSLDAKQIGQAEKSFEDPLTPEREIPSRSPSLPLVVLQEKEKERGKRLSKG
jgi:hypothetical protein